MRRTSISPRNTEFVVLSFEGPDDYSMAGGLGVRVINLSTTLASLGFTTHLFFVGDPDLPGEETRHDGKLILHRWCQWISEYHPNGVYDGQGSKLYDFNDSIPPFVKEQVVKPAVAANKLVAVLGEEWHTAEAMCRLSDLLHYDGLRDKAVMFWNANNTFSFERINWGRLNFTTTITTVSRYMKHIMWGVGVNPLVIPNGIPRALLSVVDEGLAEQIRRLFDADLLLCKVARWDLDKRWHQAIEAMAKLKDRGLKVTLLARGGLEPHGQEVIRNARSLGLVVREAHTGAHSHEARVAALRAAIPADIINIRFQLPSDFLEVLYRACDSVLANSGREPFGLVGLEAMAAGGIVFTGSTGEDYAIPFVNAFSLETDDPMEIVNYLLYLQDYPEEGSRMRQAARQTAAQYTWEAAAQNLVAKIENQARIQGALKGKPVPQETEPDLPKLPPELLPASLKSDLGSS